MKSKHDSILGGSLLVAGTTIGGGMLALPVLTSLTGFIPSVVLYFICWLFMVSTALLFLEVSQWMWDGANIISMARKTLGPFGKYFAWVVYLFMFYCLTVAYIVGCGNILAELTQSLIPDRFAPLLFVLLFFPLILIPTFLASKLNIPLVIGLVVSFFGFVILGFSYVKPAQLLKYDWSYSMSVLPIAFAAFAFHGIIPTLASYLDHNPSKIRKAIFLGSFIPFVTYIIWQWLILGIVPLEGPNGLQATLQAGNNAVFPLKFFIQNQAVYLLGQVFAFFALVTSLLGVTLGLRDFLADGLHIHKDVKGKISLALLVFVPPLIIATSYPNVFLVALDYAGGFGSALLLGLLPIMMVWRGRYHQSFTPVQHQLPGGKPLLILLGLFVSIEVLSECIHLYKRLFD